MKNLQLLRLEIVSLSSKDIYRGIYLTIEHFKKDSLANKSKPKFSE